MFLILGIIQIAPDVAPGVSETRRVHADDYAIELAVDAARTGDRAAFAAIYDSYFDRVYRYAVARTSCRNEAEDVTSETFIAAWRSLPRFQWQGAPFITWLIAICHRQALQHMRRAERHGRTGFADTQPDAGEHEIDHAPHVVDRLHVQELLQVLAGEQRQVLELRFYAALSTEQIGAVMDRSAGAVRQLQLRALTQLRGNLVEMADAA